jgi:hypothetical protein
VNKRVLSVWKAIVLFLETRRTFRGCEWGFEWKCDALPMEMILLGKGSGGQGERGGIMEDNREQRKVARDNGK